MSERLGAFLFVAFAGVLMVEGNGSDALTAAVIALALAHLAGPPRCDRHLNPGHPPVAHPAPPQRERTAGARTKRRTVAPPPTSGGGGPAPAPGCPATQPGAPVTPPATSGAPGTTLDLHRWR